MTLLHALGLDETCEAVYRSALAAPVVDPANLAKSMPLPEAQITGALVRLSELALIRPSLDHPGKFCSVRPELGLAALLHRHEEEVASRTAHAARARRAVSEFLAGTFMLDARRHSTAVSQLDGRDAVHARIEVVARRHGVEVLSVIPGGPVPAGVLTDERALDERLLASGASLRRIYQFGIGRDPATISHAKWMISQGAEVRTGMLLPCQMTIIDQSIAFVPLTPSGEEGGSTLEVTAEGLVTLLLGLFEGIWHDATPIGAKPTPEPLTGLSRPDRQLLSLLAAGLTDEAAAKRLGMSVRTVRRSMARLMRQLNATSRFEAGLKAQRHWLLDSVSQPAREMGPAVQDGAVARARGHLQPASRICPRAASDALTGG